MPPVSIGSCHMYDPQLALHNAFKAPSGETRTSQKMFSFSATDTFWNMAFSIVLRSLQW